jgi:hypothetical protein
MERISALDGLAASSLPADAAPFAIAFLLGLALSAGSPEVLPFLIPLLSAGPILGILLDSLGHEPTMAPVGGVVLAIWCTLSTLGALAGFSVRIGWRLSVDRQLRRSLGESAAEGLGSLLAHSWDWLWHGEEAIRNEKRNP